MPKKLFRPLHHSQGFTLVEMIGVLAIIAILIALLLPKIFTLIASSKASSLAAAVRTYETAVTKYYGDIGTIWPLNAAGTPAQENGGNSATVTSLRARLTLDASDPLNTGANQWSDFEVPTWKNSIPIPLRDWAQPCTFQHKRQSHSEQQQRRQMWVGI